MSNEYARILSDAINQSGMSLEKITKEAYLRGVNFTTSYLCKLKNGNMSPASDSITKGLEKILGITDNELLLAAYRQKIPDNIYPIMVKKYSKEEVLI